MKLFTSLNTRFLQTMPHCTQNKATDPNTFVYGHCMVSSTFCLSALDTQTYAAVLLRTTKELSGQGEQGVLDYVTYIGLFLIKKSPIALKPLLATEAATAAAAVRRGTVPSFPSPPLLLSHVTSLFLIQVCGMFRRATNKEGDVALTSFRREPIGGGGRVMSHAIPCVGS